MRPEALQPAEPHWKHLTCSEGAMCPGKTPEGRPLSEALSMKHPLFNTLKELVMRMVARAAYDFIRDHWKDWF